MKIGKLSKISGCSIQTIRYYEKEGLLRSPARSEGNYRLYNKQSVKEVEFIRHCRSLDISLSNIKRLIELKNNPEASCTSVNNLIDEQLLLVNKRMKELKHLKDELQYIANSCNSENTIKTCGIIQSLDI